jgi:hypothetical protein
VDSAQHRQGEQAAASLGQPQHTKQKSLDGSLGHPAPVTVTIGAGSKPTVHIVAHAMGAYPGHTTPWPPEASSRLGFEATTTNDARPSPPCYDMFTGCLEQLAFADSGDGQPCSPFGTGSSLQLMKELFGDDVLRDKSPHPGGSHSPDGPLDILHQVGLPGCFPAQFDCDSVHHFRDLDISPVHEWPRGPIFRQLERILRLALCQFHPLVAGP